MQLESIDCGVQTEESASALVEKVPIVWSGKYNVRFCGLQKLHPFESAKGYHIIKLLKKDEFWENAEYYAPANEISKEELLKVHTSKYLRSLKWSINAAKISEIPLLFFVPNYLVQCGYLRPMRFQAAGSVMAGKLALEYGWAINLGGGFHHCCSAKGGGFCAYADITMLIKKLLEVESNVKKVMIIDLDAHQGNGHERDFMHNESVFIMDMYNNSIYPMDYTAQKAINCAVELLPYTNTAEYMRNLKRAYNKSLGEFEPDLIVFNAGTDILKNDPLGMLSITPEGVILRDEYVFSVARLYKIPIVMLLSGGYLKSSAKVIADSIKNLRVKGWLDKISK